MFFCDMKKKKIRNLLTLTKKIFFINLFSIYAYVTVEVFVFLDTHIITNYAKNLNSMLVLKMYISSLKNSVHSQFNYIHLCCQ